MQNEKRDKMCVIVTNHAKERTHERVGIPKRIINKNSEKAFAEGIAHCELSGSLKRFVDGLYLKNRSANNIRIYCGNVYLFAGNILITVIALPEKYRKTADRIWKNRSSGVN